MAIQERIRADRRRLRERRRQQAMLAYGDESDIVFEALEGEDFEDRHPFFLPITPEPLRRPRHPRPLPTH